MFTLDLFIISPNWKQIKCPSIDKCINKHWHINLMEYYSAMKRDVPLIHSTWMNLKSIMLNERSQTQRNIQYIIPFILDKRNLIYADRV